MTEFGEDFGQKVDLTASIRNILRNYPEGTAIFKELIQNADDAGANIVRFCFDNRDHEVANLADGRLAQFQGPSLLVYNNAIFTKEDLQSIQRIGDSLKNIDEQSKTKIGRFGIGFNAVYHWTELPSFITDKYLVLLDPQARFLPNVNPANPGKLVDWMANRKLLTEYRDQFSPYAMPGMDWSRPFQGTIFRLPLRTAEQASTSFLSKRSVSTGEMMEVLQSLAQEANSMLLFLRSVAAIEISVWNAGETSPTKIYECKIKNMSTILQKKRSFDEVLGKGRAQQQTPLHRDFTLEIEAFDASRNATIQEKWEVCTQFGGGDAIVIATDPARAHLKLVPLGGLAANTYRVSSLSSEPIDCNTHGKAYCFLPLPLETGLPVMVNGFFELSSNRRDIWQESADMTGDGKARAHWNLSLLKDVLVPCYTRLLIKLRDELGFSVQFEKLWPKFDLPYPWSLLGNTTLTALKNEKMLLVDHEDKSKLVWIEPSRSIALPLHKNEIELLRYLKHMKAPIVSFQHKQLHESLVKSKLCEHVASPALVRKVIKNSSQVPLHDMCRFLLSYTMSDLTTTESLLELNDLTLLPLKNGALGKLLVFNASQCQAIKTLVSMGFPVQDSMTALLGSAFNADSALEKLAGGEFKPSNSLFILAPLEDMSIFEQAYSMIVDTEAIGAAEIERFRKNETFSVTNLRFFSPELLSNILRPILPSICFKKPIIDVKSELQEKERESLFVFLPKLWKYLGSNTKALAALYEQTSIVPVNSFTSVCAISRLSNLLIASKDQNSIDEELQQVLQLLHIRIVDRPLLDCDVNIFPATFWEYAHAPSLRGLCSVLAFAEREQGKEFYRIFDGLEAAQRALIRSFFVDTARHDIANEDKDIIRKLPVFRLAYLHKTKVQFIALLADGKKLDVKTCPDLSSISDELYPEDFLYYDSPKEMMLLRALQVSLLSKADFYKQAILLRLSVIYAPYPEQTEQALLTMFRDVRSFEEEQKDILGLIKTLPCVPNNSAELKKMNDLFDPSDPEILSLMGDSLLPKETFRSEDVLIALRQAGLRRSLDLHSLMLCARSIESMDKSQMDEKQSKGKSFMAYLEKNLGKLLGEETTQRSTSFSLFSNIKSLFVDDSASKEEIALFKKEIKQIKWLPIQLEPSSLHMPWKEDSKEVVCARPKDTRPATEAWYCSNSMYISLESTKSSALRAILGWDFDITAVIFAKQLCAILKVHEELVQTKSNNIASFSNEVNTHIRYFYRAFNEADEAVRSEVFMTLEGLPWIWIGNRFVSSDKVAIHSTINATPYLYQLPEVLKSFPYLLKIFCIRDTFSARDFISALNQMANDHKESVLHEDLLAMAISMIVSSASESSSFLQTQTIYVPDINGRLAVASELLNDDVPWLAGDEFLALRASSRLVNSKISSSVAEKIGVRSLRLSLVKNNLEQNWFGHEQTSNSNIQSFGQAESLTNRLKTILDLYPDGSPILNELIQNADDAGATVVRILVDENHYRTESLMDARMEFLQGPALLVQNDSTFTEADFKSLASVGQASKLDRLATTGRFGLGFNATYHLTDTPSFISGDHLVFFDPHCAFLPGATINQPGIRIKFPKSDLHRAFSDQFEPFQHFDFNCSESYPGTLFRFPLRTPMLAKKSEICKRSYNLNDVYSLLSQLVDQFAHLCLFLRSVQRIEVYSCKENTSTPKILYSSSVSTIRKNSYNDQSLMSYFEKSITGLNRKEGFYSKLGNTPDEKLPLIVCTKLISIEKPVESSDIVSTIISTPRLELEYEVVHGLRGGQAKALAGHETAKHLKLVPYGCVAACVSRKQLFLTQETAEESFPKLSGQLFCFLPLPITTSLPVHINAYWELSSNRRDIWRGDDTKGEAKLRADWNVAIMKDVLAPLYTHLLSRLNQIMVDKKLVAEEKQILDWLPCPIPPAPWNILAESVYPLAKQKALFWTLGHYEAAKNIFLLEPQQSMGQSFNELNNMRWLEEVMLEENIPVVSLHTDLHKTLLKYGCVAGVIDPTFVRSHFNITAAKHSHPSLVKKDSNEVRLNNVVELLRFCLKDVAAVHNYEHMIGVKLLPLSNGTLATFDSVLDATETYFLASELETKLLFKCSHRLVVSNESLGNELLKLLTTEDLGSVLNVRSLETIDVLKLVSSMLPRSWLAEEAICMPRTTDIDDSWLVSMWSYILDNKLLDLYQGTMPLFPILTPYEKNLFEAKYLARFAKDVYIVYNINNMTPSVIEALSKMNIFVLDIVSMKPFLHREDFSQLLQEQGVAGILNGMLAYYDRKGFEDLKSLKTEIKLSLHSYILNEVLLNMNSLAPQCKAMLRALPIWIKHGYINPNYSPAIFSDIGDESCKVPPRDVPNSLFNSTFVSIKEEVHRKAYVKLGLEECSTGQFFVNYIIPRLSSSDFPDSDVQWISSFLLNNYSQLEVYSDKVAASLKECPIFPNGTGDLRCAASSLYDPDQPLLRTFLPESLFPSTLISSNSIYLYTLKKIGLRREVSPEDILNAAKSIQEAQDFYLNLINENPSKWLETADYKELVHKSTALLKYLSVNIERILAAVDDEGLKRLKTVRDTTLDPSELNEEGNLCVGGDWGVDLRSIMWLPALIDVPGNFQHSGLPWPSRIHSVPFAAPSQCSMLSNIWFCSCSMRICSIDVTTPLLLAAFEWNRPLPGRTIALQLISVSEEFQKVTSVQVASHDKHRIKLVQTLDQIYPLLLAHLQNAYTSESEGEVALWSRVLSGKPILWMNVGLFVEPSRVAFQGLANVRAEPFLFVVSAYLNRYKDMLTDIGVKETFAMHDLSALTREYHKANGQLALNSDWLETMISVSQLLISMIHDATEESEESVVESLGDIFLPDTNKFLHQAKALTYNDAPWIVSSLGARLNSFKMVHSRISATHAKVLGARSLRELLFAGEDVICPNANQLACTIEDHTLCEVMDDMCSLASQIGAKRVEFIFDETSYAKESLLHPGLAETQGPALMICFDVQLNREQISRIITPASAENKGGVILSAESSTKSLAAAFAVCDCLEILSGNEFYIFDPCGKYLLGDMEESSESNTAPETEEAPALRNHSSEKSPAARRFRIDQSMDRTDTSANMLNNFSHQFEPFTSLPDNLIGSLVGEKMLRNSMLVRLPLRSSASSLAKSILAVSEVQRVFGSYKSNITGFIIFSPTLSSVRLSHMLSKEYNTQLFLQVISDEAAKQQRLKLLQTTGWEKQGLTKLLSKPYVPPELYYSVKLCVKVISNPWIKVNPSLKQIVEQFGLEKYGEANTNVDTLTIEETWLVCSCIGHSSLKDLALSEPYSSLNLKPFVSMAMQYLEHWQLSRHNVPAETGQYYCGSTLVGQTGFPFHVEGSFIASVAHLSKQNKDAGGMARRGSVKIDTVTRAIASWNTNVFITALEKLYPKALQSCVKRVMSDSSLTSRGAKDENGLNVLEGLYKYWIYTQRLTNIARKALEGSKLITYLCKEPLYLISNQTLQTLDKVLLNTDIDSFSLLSYLYDYIPLARAPKQVGLDLIASGAPVADMSPARMRAYLKKDSPVHLQKFTRLLSSSSTKNEAYKLLKDLLQYIMKDLMDNKDEGEFAKRKLYRSLQGVPILLMSDQTIRSFPMVMNDQIAITNYMSYFRILPPLVLNRLLHPWIAKASELFSDHLFQDSLFISPFNARFLKDILPNLLPNGWSKRDGVVWTSSDYSVPQVSLDLLLYILWNESLQRESVEDLLSLQDVVPCLPVLCSSNRVLVSTKLIAYILVSPPSPSQDEARRTLRLTAKQKQDQYHTLPDIKLEDKNQENEWQWAKDNVEVLDINEEPIVVTADIVDATEQTTATTAATETVVNTATPNTGEDTSAVDYGNFKLSTYNTLLKAGLPFLDAGIFESIPAGVVGLRSTDSIGRRLVEVSHRLIELNSMVLKPDQVSIPLLSFDSLTVVERNMLLMEIYDAHKATAFDTALVDKTKSLPLFTNSVGQSAVSLTEMTGSGVYWCEDKQVLKLIERFVKTTAGPNQSAKPVVLVNDHLLKDVYRWLNVLELTAILAMTKFIVPFVEHMDCNTRLLLLRELSSKWGNYRSDPALVDMLKTKQWVPVWQKDHPEAWREDNLSPSDCAQRLRRVNELVSWTNSDLVESLESSSLPQYIAPPSMQIAENHVFFTDLGMQSELTFDIFYKIIQDIEAHGISTRDLVAENAAEAERGLKECIERGRKILLYVLENDRLLEITASNVSHVKKIGQVHFVPMLKPVRIEEGGHLVYKDELGAFHQFVGRAQGALCFTLLPILEEGLTPPMILFSHLGLISHPPEDVVMRHLRLLIQSVSLDRWNAPFSISQTFSAVFTYLHDKWSHISPSIKTALQTSPLLPIGSSLIPPNRVFFRLAEDLSPFMHELPRQFGAHESLLKTLGVRESPTLQDYVSFTAELAQEMRGQALNPNEMKAMLLLSATLLTFLEEQGGGLSPLSVQLHLPDEESVLRRTLQMIVSDDEILRGRTSEAIESLGYSFLHSSLTSLGTVLQIPRLSQIVLEQISEKKTRLEGAPDSALRDRVQAYLLHPRLAHLLQGLHEKYTQDTSLLRPSLSQVQILFASPLFTSYCLVDPTRHGTLPLDHSEAGESSFYVDKARPCLYLNPSLLNSSPLHSLELLLSLALCVLFSLPRETAFALAQALQSLAGGEGREVEQLLGLGAGRRESRVVVGRELVQRDYALAELRPLKVFTAGEIVAYESAEERGVLCYGRVVAVGEANEAGLRKMEVRTGKGVERFLSSSVYTFKSTRGTVVAQSSRNKQGESKVPPPLPPLPRSGKGEGGGERESQAGGETGGLQIERGDVLLAVQSLLGRVGLPLHLDQQNLMHRVLELEAQQKEAEDALQSERAHLQQSKQRMQSQLQRYLCAICLEQSVQRSLVPCGHCFCERCANALQGSRCPTCRSHIEKKLKLYVGGEET